MLSHSAVHPESDDPTLGLHAKYCEYFTHTMVAPLGPVCTDDGKDWDLFQPAQASCLSPTVQGRTGVRHGAGWLGSTVG